MITLHQLIKRLEQAEVTCHLCGDLYGKPSVGVSSNWLGHCHICNRLTTVTETRDYGYFQAGLTRLRKTVEKVKK